MFLPVTFELEKLFLELAFSGKTLQGKFGSSTLTAYDLLHNSSVSSLKNLHVNLKAEISKQEANTDEWTTSSHEQSQLQLKKEWVEYVYMLIGYKRSEAQKEQDSATLKDLKNKLKELEESTATPEQKIKDLKEEISKYENKQPEAAAAVSN